ncbi:Hypothetical protein PHPALM_7147 [Phytophthora palmivora]|uniref:Uncharacterized protein n=1 Tax=Phytophthora palmivora TaxID=4796 RepID=A0A2P4YD25_9STRA|nr:Hypothetical protein PHPALM_7145 [Phytophthora palmivora]POM75714.1 Hypothetical protein PHPALM_7147 [Phytophthora palmivora]
MTLGINSDSTIADSDGCCSKLMSLLAKMITGRALLSRRDFVFVTVAALSRAKLNQRCFQHGGFKCVPNLNATNTLSDTVTAGRTVAVTPVKCHERANSRCLLLGPSRWKSLQTRGVQPSILPVL